MIFILKFIKGHNCAKMKMELFFYAHCQMMLYTFSNFMKISLTFFLVIELTQILY